MASDGAGLFGGRRHTISFALKHHSWINLMHKAALLFVAFASCVSCSAMAEDAKTKSKWHRAAERGYTAVTPIFSELVAMSVPKGFVPAYAKQSGNSYIQEAVLEGETVDEWSQMITVTGAKGLAASRDLSAQLFAERIANRFKQHCPDTFSTKEFGATKVSGHDAFVALASCGTAPSHVNEHSETALLIAITGSADYYTIQWAERGPASGQPMALNAAKWRDRFKKLNPITICALAPGEAASCADQK